MVNKLIYLEHEIKQVFEGGNKVWQSLASVVLF